MGKHLLETVTGKMFDVLNPKEEDVDIVDIAWSLSRQARFNSHTIPLIPYSVAQHSIMVAKTVAKLYPDNYHLIASALLHDSPETYVSDIPSPVKHLPGVHEEVKKVEDKIFSVILKHFGVCHEGWFDTVIHEADLKQRAVEAHNFMFSRGKDWGLPKVTLLELQEFEDPWTSIKAYEQFTTYFNLVMCQIKNPEYRFKKEDE